MPGVVDCARIPGGTIKSMTYEFPKKNLTDIANEHSPWIVLVGWANTKTPWEHLALIGSEIGEAANECRGEDQGFRTTKKFGSEMADIVLRCITFIIEMNYPFEPGVWTYENHSGERLLDICGDSINDVVDWCQENCHLFDRYDAFSEDDKSPLALLTELYRPLSDLVGAVEMHGRHDERAVGLMAKYIRDFLMSVMAVAGICGVDMNEALQKKVATNKATGTKGRAK